MTPPSLPERVGVRQHEVVTSAENDLLGGLNYVSNFTFIDEHF